MNVTYQIVILMTIKSLFKVVYFHQSWIYIKTFIRRYYFDSFGSCENIDEHIDFLHFFNLQSLIS